MRDITKTAAKFWLGEYVFRMNNNKVEMFTVTEVRMTKKDTKSRVSVVYGLDNNYMNVPEHQLFKTKQELLDTL